MIIRTAAEVLQDLTLVISVAYRRIGGGMLGPAESHGLAGPPEAVPDIPDIAVYDDGPDNVDTKPQKPEKIRSLFPETWLWDIVSIRFVLTS